jgi:hypothetical protein
MNDDFELRLQSTFRSASLPPAPDTLHAFVARLPQPAQRRVRWPMPSLLRAAAAVAIVAVTGAVFAFALGQQQPPPAAQPTGSPSPSLTAEPSPPAADGRLPEPAELAADFPSAAILIERSAGPAERARSDDPVIERIELGGETWPTPVILAAACLGPGELTVEIRLPSVAGASGEAFPGLVVPCDGQDRHLDYSGQPAYELQVVALTVARGASWRMIAAQTEAPVTSPPPAAMSPVTGTAGWWLLWNVEPPPPAAGGEGTSVRLIVPQPVTRIGVSVSCTAESAVDLTVSRGDETAAYLEAPLACDALAGARHEFPVAGGEDLTIKAVAEEPVFINMRVEGDREPTITYPTAPPLPPDIAATAYAAVSPDYIALGTIGSNRQRLIPARPTFPWHVGGADLVAVGINPADAEGRFRLDLFSASRGAAVRTLVEAPAGWWVGRSWIDPLHEHVFYQLISQAGEGMEIRRISVDGSDDQVIASVPPAEVPAARAALALDYSVFVVDSCRAAGQCTRQVIDTTTLEPTSHELDVQGDYCELIGAAEGLVLFSAADSCFGTGPEHTIVSSLGGDSDVEFSDIPGGTLVRTSDGPRLVYRSVADVVHYDVTDMAGNETLTLDVDGELMAPVGRLALPPDWILFAGGLNGLDDFPTQQFVKGPVPVLVNVLTGEQIELPNLPHAMDE